MTEQTNDTRASKRGALKFAAIVVIFYVAYLIADHVVSYAYSLGYAEAAAGMQSRTGQNIAMNQTIDEMANAR